MRPMLPRFPAAPCCTFTCLSLLVHLHLTCSPARSTTTQEAMDAKCAATKVDPAVARQLLATLDFDRVRREAKASTVLTVGEACVKLDLGVDYFFDAREALRKRSPEEMKWAL